MCELLVGLPAVRVLGVDDQAGGPLWVHIETVADRPVCPGCGGPATLKDRRGRADRPARVRSTYSAGVAQASLGMPSADLSCGVVDGAEPGDRGTQVDHDGSGRPVGDRTGRPVQSRR